MSAVGTKARSLSPESPEQKQEKQEKQEGKKKKRRALSIPEAFRRVKAGRILSTTSLHSNASRSWVCP